MRTESIRKRPTTFFFFLILQAYRKKALPPVCIEQFVYNPRCSISDCIGNNKQNIIIKKLYRILLSSINAYRNAKVVIVP